MVSRRGSMKNFPHQYNDIAKLRGTLEVIRDLDAAGENVGDDGVLGYELARRQIYRFRGLDYEATDLDRRLRRRIQEEQKKDSGTQGARTAAREMRRTLVALGWIDSNFDTTRAGTELLQAAQGSPEEIDVLLQSLSNLQVTDADGETSHPVLIMLRLIRDYEFSSRDGMELILEAKNDTDAEYRRIEGLLQLTRAQRQSRLGVSDYQVDNAKKILPTLALQAGLIAEDPTGTYVLTPSGEAALAGGLGTGRRVTPARRSPRPRRSTRTSAARQVTQKTAGSRRITGAHPRTAEEQIETTQLLVERTDRHQDLVQALAGKLSKFKCYEDPYSFDLVADPQSSPARVFLWEVKTLRDDASDAPTQARLALGQILFYENFAIPLKWSGAQVVRAALFERPISRELADFLNVYQVAAFTLEQGALKGLNDAARAIEPDL